MERSFVERLKEAMDRKGMNQYQLARAIDAPVTTVNSWFTGKAEPRPEYLQRIVRELNVSPAWLLFGEAGLRYDPDILRSVIRAVEELERMEGLDIRPEKKAELVTILYEESLEEEKGVQTEEVQDMMHRLLRLAT
ncbi:MAG: helix-turn-helix domain-containing protein [Nitrospirota bacterium]|jgi:transcriptional regulator with XRE-family HTH domain